MNYATITTQLFKENEEQWNDLQMYYPHGKYTTVQEDGDGRIKSGEGTYEKFSVVIFTNRYENSFVQFVWWKHFDN